MTNVLGQLRGALQRLLEAAVVVIMTALVLIVLWRVATRFWLDLPSPWTEEAARLLMIWLAMLGAGVAYARRAHLGVNVVVDRMAPEARRSLAVFAELVVGLFAAVALLYGGGVLVVETLQAKQLTPALGLKMGYVYLAIPSCGAFLLIVCLERLLDLLGGSAVDANATPESDRA